MIHSQIKDNFAAALKRADVPRGSLSWKQYSIFFLFGHKTNTLTVTYVRVLIGDGRRSAEVSLNSLLVLGKVPQAGSVLRSRPGIPGVINV